MSAAPSLSLRHGVRSALLWTAWSAGTRFALQLGLSIVLARLLSPADFGRTGMVAAFMSMLAPIASASLSQAVIAQRDDSHARVSSLFWTSVLLGGFAGLAFYAAAPAIALYYEDPTLTPIARAFAVSFALTGIGTVPEGILRKRMAFSSVSRIEVAIGAASSLVAIGCAFAGFGVWSLVAQALAQSALAAVWWLLASGFRPALTIQKQAVREGVSFGSALSLTDIMSLLANTAHTFILGRALGAQAMGLYARAIGISQLLQTHVGTLASSVMFPALASLDDPKRIKSATLQATAATVFATAPITAGLVTTGDLVVAVLYGDQWTPAVVPLRVLAVALFINIALFPIVTLYRSMQRADLLLRVAAPAALLSIATAIAGTSIGSLEAVAWFQLMCSVVMIAPHVLVAGGLVGIDLRTVLRTAGSSVGCAAAMGLSVFAARTIAPALPPVLELASCALLGVMVYAGLAFGLRVAPLYNLLKLMRERSVGPST